MIGIIKNKGENNNKHNIQQLTKAITSQDQTRNTTTAVVLRENSKNQELALK